MRRSLYARASGPVYVPSVLDPLSHILTLLRPREVGWRLIVGRGGWTLHLPPRRDIVVFGHLLEAACEVRREGEAPIAVTSGDFILIASPRPWSMRAPGPGPEVGLKALFADPSLLAGDGDPKTVTRFVGGYFAFDAVGAGLVGELLPSIVHVSARMAAAGRLAPLVAMLGEEAQSARAGRGHVLERLLELMLVEVLRLPGLGWDEASPGLLRGLSDARIGRALERMHGDVGRAWTVAELARIAGMSRSTFALRFQQLVGRSPVAYLLDWRMTLARQALRAGAQPIGVVATNAGFQSVSAFSTAFRRATGMSPTRYAASAG